MAQLFQTSIGRKVAMALSAFFLMVFLLQHFTINSLSVISPEAFNEVSHFMGTNPLVQFVLQPVLIFGVVFHFLMGFILDIQNRRANGQTYIKYNGAANAKWVSRHMLLSGLVILGFMALHFVDFWFPEVNIKFIQGDWSGTAEGVEGFRYYEELRHKFVNPYRVGAYSVAFVFLALHLNHGFTSAFQSVGSNWGRKKVLQTVGLIYSYVIPAGFIGIALFHHFTH
jgi:succinate dehydrogenase / fumarate reductase, cytochrome b subunit